MNTHSKQLFEDSLHRIYAIPPNDLGNRWLTSVYKRLTGPLKHMTVFYILIISGMVALSSYIVLGQLTIKLVSLLQHGF